MALQLDHVVILVKNLDKGISQYQKEGFKVSKGGKHNNGITENALIHFKNGTFLEILAVRKRWKARWTKLLFQSGYLNPNSQSLDAGFQQRFVGRALLCPEGIIDFCLLATAGEQDFGEIQKRNIKTTNLTQMQRLKPDGQLLTWKIFAPFSPYLPFVMTPYEPPFSPPVANLEHENGITGIGKFSIYVPQNDFESTIQSYTQFLGKPITYSVTKATFQLVRGQVEVCKGDAQLGFSISYLR